MRKKLIKLVKKFFKKLKKRWKSYNYGQKKYIIAFIIINLIFLFAVLGGLLYVVLWAINR